MQGLVPFWTIITKPVQLELYYIKQGIQEGTEDEFSPIHWVSASIIPVLLSDQEEEEHPRSNHVATFLGIKFMHKRKFEQEILMDQIALMICW